MSQTNPLRSFATPKSQWQIVALAEAWMRVLSPEYADDKKLADLRKTPFYKEIVRDFMPSLRTIFDNSAKADAVMKNGE